MTTTEYELRYRGGLLGVHPSLDAAKAHKAKHHADVEDQHELTTEPARPVRLFCRGNLVETFHDPEDAHSFVAKKATPMAPLVAWLAVDITTPGGKTIAEQLAEHARQLDVPPAPATAPPVLEHDAAAALEHHAPHAPHGAEAHAASSGRAATTTSSSTSPATTGAAGAGAPASPMPAPPPTPEPPPTGR